MMIRLSVCSHHQQYNNVSILSNALMHQQTLNNAEHVKTVLDDAVTDGICFVAQRACVQFTDVER